MNNDTTYTSPFVYVIALFLAFSMLTFPFLAEPYLTDSGPTWLGLDVSWQMTINYANINNWTWGKDISYTYGPLGFLSMRMGWGVSRWVFLLFDMFLVVNFFYVFKDFLKASASKLLGLMILVVAILLMNTSHGTDLSWLLLFFIYFWLYKIYNRPSTASFAMVILLVVIAFFNKFNTGLISVCFFATHLVLMYFADKLSLGKALMIFTALLATILLSSWLLNVNLPAYILGAIEVVRGYGDVMYLANGEIDVERNLATIYNLIKYLFIAFFIYVLLKGRFVQFFFIGICAVYIYALKQQAYLRGDIQHLSEFFAYGPLVLLVGNMLYYKNNTQKLFSSAILFILTLSLFFKTEYNNKISQLYKERFNNKKEYFSQFAASGKAQHVFHPEKRYIPDTILAKIGNSTIDVFPWDSEYLIENQLNYHPRPVFQSFSAYTPYLQKLNYDFFCKEGAEYILYDYDAIDNRCPINDEAMLNLYILKNYELTDTFTSNERLRALLKRKSTANNLVFNKIEERKLSFSERIPMVNGVNFIKVFVNRNFKGKMVAFKLRPPAINISFTTDSGYTREYRTSPQLLEAGVVIDKLITSQQEFISLLTQKELGNNITKVKLMADQALYESEITVEYYNVK